MAQRPLRASVQLAKKAEWRLRKYLHTFVPGAWAPPVKKATSSEAISATDPLTPLAHRFKSDKGWVHRYTEHYAAHFAPWRHKKFTLLEIGIGGYDKPGEGGGSLRMWKEFFPEAIIIGLDIADKSFIDEDRVITYRGSQVDPAILRRIVEEHGPLEIVIDDGSHLPAHVIETFGYLFPLLAPEGIYAIEDIQSSYWPSYGGRTNRRARSTSMALVKDLIDGLNHVEFTNIRYQPSYTDTHVVAVHAYHNLVFVQKGINDEPSNVRFDRR